MVAPISLERRSRIRELHRLGWSQRQIVAELGTAHKTIRAVLRDEFGDTRPFVEWEPGPGRLAMGEREEIAVALSHGLPYAEVARALGRSTSTVSREVAANGGRDGYRASMAHRRAFDRCRRPKARKLAPGPLSRMVLGWVEAWWSPEQIARRLRLEYPDDPMMWVSHETIYQSIYVQGRGELRRELARCLRSGRAQRQPRARMERRGRIPDMVSISERPAEIEDRAVPGHWEGDLIIGKDGKSAVGTIVERTTRFLVLFHLPEGRDAQSVADALRQVVAAMPAGVFRSITWDQGREMAHHTQFTADTGIPVYFCDPHTPWQRGLNENTNGLVRQYLPKGTDLSSQSVEDLRRIARSLNRRPRKVLGYMTPSEELTEHLALTA